jgi:DNA-directed RNA polymerase subunit RPC12/RpoP
MGEIAEMMLDGTLCEGCGVYLQGRPRGFPRRCADCRRSASEPHPDTKVPCKTCGRHVKFIGMRDHVRDAHGCKA